MAYQPIPWRSTGSFPTKHVPFKNQSKICKSMWPCVSNVWKKTLAISIIWDLTTVNKNDFKEFFSSPTFHLRFLQAFLGFPGSIAKLLYTHTPLQPLQTAHRQGGGSAGMQWHGTNGRWWRIVKTPSESAEGIRSGQLGKGLKVLIGIFDGQKVLPFNFSNRLMWFVLGVLKMYLVYSVYIVHVQVFPKHFWDKYYLLRLQKKMEL